MDGSWRRRRSCPCRGKMDDVITTCSINRQLLKDVVAKLTEIESLSKAQKDAVAGEDAKLIEELHAKIQAVFRGKERAVEAWIKHHREHGC